jgi:UPF0176 protein
MALHNRVNGKILKERIKTDTEPRKTLSFYRYHHIAAPAAFRDALYQSWAALDVLGRAYVAAEGINAQISVPVRNLEALKGQIESISFLTNLRLNIAIEDNGKSFFKLKIQVRSKIVADGIVDKDFDVTNSGQHLNAAGFNHLADQKDTVIVDMRNHYESEVGRFRNAICPDADTFRDELKIVGNLLNEEKDKSIVMYCTGGIRCEKASAWMKHIGFKNVFQLDGGIIEYTRQVREQGLENKFVGKNFVFDERLGERISNDIISSCHQCGNPCDTHVNCRNDGCHLLFIQCDTCASKYSNCCSTECQTTMELPESKQKEIRKGVNKGRQVFRKGRSSHLAKKIAE